MPIPSLEERLTALEKEMAELKHQIKNEQAPPSPHPWDKVFGAFANSEGFEEATRLGREYRESLRPSEDAF